MTSQYEMQLPFTTKKEIHDREACYIDGQSEKRQCEEQTVIDLRKKAHTRQSHKTPGGYLLIAELRKMAQWKSHFLPSKIDENDPPKLIEEITAAAFYLDDDWEKLKKLKDIYGVSESVASVILHLYDRKEYPILDVHALRSIGIDNKEVNYDAPLWRKYVNFCRTEAERYEVSMRKLDRALYKYSESGAALALKIIADETLLLELARRGYDLSSLRDNETTAEIIKIG